MSTTSNGLVSIPFIAGQWSLPIMVAGTPPDFACLNPLHCGAVVASKLVPLRQTLTVLVSIPFIAGQWSLPG